MDICFRREEDILKTRLDINYSTNLYRKLPKSPSLSVRFQLKMDIFSDIYWVDIIYEWIFFGPKNDKIGRRSKNSETSKCPRSLCMTPSQTNNVVFEHREHNGYNLMKNRELNTAPLGNLKKLNKFGKISRCDALLSRFDFRKDGPSNFSRSTPIA